jgi:hypothetical protein
MAYFVSKYDKTRGLDNYSRTEIGADEETVNSLSYVWKFILHTSLTC